MKSRYSKTANIILNAIIILLCLTCIIPLLLIISISLTSESGIASNGYSLIPSEWGFEAYKFIWQTRASILSAYKVTVLVTVLGTLLSTAVIILYAYPLSRSSFKYKQFFTFYVFFTMLFSGGLVAWYMVCTTVLHLSNTMLALILPYAMNAWYVIIMRTFYKTSVPEALIESAKLDGASEIYTFVKIVIPISVPGIATIALFQTLTYWNDWWLPLNFITEKSLYNLQFLLQNMLANIEDLTKNENFAQNASAVQLANLPTEGARMALCMVALGPILIVYPFFQKYFIQGLTVGAVKG